MVRSLILAFSAYLVVVSGAAAQEFKIYTAKKTSDSKANGVRITSIPKYGIETEIGLKPGDIILSINERTVSNDKELGEALGKIKVHKVTEERDKPTTTFILMRPGKKDEFPISGWIIQSSFPDAKTGRPQFFFRGKDSSKPGANSK